MHHFEHTNGGQTLIRKYQFSDESGDLQCRNDPNVSKFFAVGAYVNLPDELDLRLAAIDSANGIPRRLIVLDRTA